MITKSRQLGCSLFEMQLKIADEKDDGQPMTSLWLIYGRLPSSYSVIKCVVSQGHIIQHTVSLLSQIQYTLHTNILQLM